MCGDEIFCSICIPSDGGMKFFVDKFMGMLNFCRQIYGGVKFVQPFYGGMNFF